jgi:hypothetical protein
VPSVWRSSECNYQQQFSPNTILTEDKASGTQLIQELSAEGLFGVKPYKFPPCADKVMRLHAQTTAFENGLVFLPPTAPWLNDYINELTGFPDVIRIHFLGRTVKVTLLREDRATAKTIFATKKILASFDPRGLVLI